MKKKLIAIGTVLAAIPLLAACTGNSANSNEADKQAGQQGRYAANQPIPQFNWSQYRQTLIDVESAEVNGTATTTFFFNQGVAQPITSCPSIGFPVATTAQLSNPMQTTGNDGTGSIPQQEPNGVYTGDSSGTYVVCVSPGGVKYVQYWEGFVQTVGGPAHWANGTVQLDGSPTVIAKTK